MRRKLKKKRFKRTKLALSGKSRSRIPDKWAKTKALWADRMLRKHIPLTKRMTMASLRSMLRQYGMVYIKPSHGSRGRGVMRVERMKTRKAGKLKTSFAYQLGVRRAVFSTCESAYRSILRETKGETYIVQKGIYLIKHRGRPFDIRLVVQRAPRGGWEATATISRVAHPRKIVTNGSQGGTIYPTASLLSSYSNAAKRTSLLKQMDRLGIATAKRLRRTYPGIVEIGLDFAIDRKLKPWILEVNTAPDMCPFALLSDQTMIRKIIRYGKAYGRTYHMGCIKEKRRLLPPPHMRIARL